MVVLKGYHQAYKKKSDMEIQIKADVKKDELKKIFDSINFDVQKKEIKIGVLGCGDRRFLKHHEEIFRDLLRTDVKIFTFDIVIDHFEEEDDVIKHDCTLLLPNTPFDILYSHVLLKFIKKEKQWDVIQNAYDALKQGGAAIHVLDKEDYESDEVDLEEIENKLNENKITYKKVELKYGVGLVVEK